jgi:hypothetical protein
VFGTAVDEGLDFTVVFCFLAAGFRVVMCWQVYCDFIKKIDFITYSWKQQIALI